MERALWLSGWALKPAMVSAVWHALSGTFDPDDYWIASRAGLPIQVRGRLQGGIPSVRRPFALIAMR